ncbi:MAG TPA: DegT/DnrJ/EryC1/StrS family aminotransferase [Rhizomicrobium sp.]|nr:DegT/DnrJ/EryC1/StrS family aminotransferase [Rhizomicrobium sp.]
MSDFIPVNRPDLTGREREYLLECIDTEWISSEGPFVERFEAAMAARAGRKYGIAVANGSVAIDVALGLLNIGPGDEVILPSFTIISCAASVVRAGATPVLVDSDPHTWNMNVEQVARKITPRTKAIMVVHIYGLPVDMGPLLALSEKHGIPIVEDAAEMHGQTWNGRPCGSFGAASTFSFYPNKHVTTGEGGMVVTDDFALAERARRLRNLCFIAERRFVHEELGWNFRMTNMQAALGVAQLERLDEFVTRKRRMGARYSELLAGTPGLELPPTATNYAESIYWVYGLVLADDVGFDAREMMKRLAKHGIGTRPFFWPMHEQPVFQRMGLFKDERYPVAERLARRGFYLPSGLGLREGELERSAAATRAVMAEA